MKVSPSTNKVISLIYVEGEGHMRSTGSIPSIQTFILIAGAYWRGDSKK